MSDLDDLILLQRAIAAARFTSGESEVLLGSPRMAEIHTQVFDAIVQAKGELDATRPDGWAAWRQLANNPAHANLVVEYASRTRIFHDWSRDEQVNFLRVCIAPFVASEDEVEVLLEQCRSRPPDGR
jgi:hypothetical protein